MVRNILLTALICMFCQFGALGTKDPKSVLICYGIAFAAAGLCFWRCAVIARKSAERRQQQQLFNDYMRMQNARGYRNRR